MQVAVRLLAFVLAAALAMLVLSITATILFPGRGFLPSMRNEFLIRLRQSPGGDWSIVSSDVVPSGWAWPEIESGVAVLVVESSMGRWHPGEFGAWRMRNWALANWQGTGVESLGDPESPLSHAVRAHVESRIIPESSLWELWPGERVAPSHTPQGGGFPMWIVWSHSGPFSFRGMAPCVLVGAVGVGAWAALRVRVGRRGD